MKPGGWAVVTGTSGAIGSATAASLVADGWRVLGVDCRTAADTIDLEGEIVGDVASPATWVAVRERLAGTEHGLRGLVHSAAIQNCAPLIETEESDWDAMMAVNVKAIYLAGRALHAMLAEAAGAIVAVGSVHARATSENIAAYAASKGALSALTRALAVEWAVDRIRVNTVLPGAVDSVMLRDGLTRGHLDGGSVDAQLQQLADKTVIGRIGRPPEIAAMIQFLLDPAKSGFVTGSEFVVDGGALARLSTE